MSYRKSLILVSLFTAISLLLSASWLGCGGTLGYNEGGGGGGGEITSITVSPSALNVAKGATQQFSAVDQDDNDITSSVTWSVTTTVANISVPDFAEAADIGSIDSAGLYTAAASLPPDNSVSITATSEDVIGTAAVNLTVGENLTFTDKTVVESTFDLGIFTSPQTVAFGSIYVATFDLNLESTNITYLLSKSVDGGNTFVDTAIAMDEYSLMPQLKSDASGNLYLAYVYSSDFNNWWIGVKKTEDEGATFSELTVPQVTDATNQGGSYFTVDSDENIYLALVALKNDEPKFTKLYFMKLNAGETSFTSLGVLAAINDVNVNNHGWPNVVTAPDGSVYILYDITRDRYATDPNRDIWIRKYSSDVVGDAVKVSPNEDAGPFNAKMVIDSEGVFHVIWAYAANPDEIDAGTTVSIKYATSSDGGSTFSTPVELAAPEGDYGITYMPAMGIDFNDNLMVAYYNWDGAALDIYMLRSTDRGSSWADPVKVNDQSGVVTQTSSVIPPNVGVAADSAGRVYITGALNYTGGAGPWQLMLAIGE